jgi:hypothetical protein
MLIYLSHNITAIEIKADNIATDVKAVDDKSPTKEGRQQVSFKGSGKPTNTQPTNNKSSTKTKTEHPNAVTEAVDQHLDEDSPRALNQHFIVPS